MPPFCVPQRRKDLSKATAADVRYPLEEHERSELPVARNDSPGTGPRMARGATPADVRRRPAQARASARRSRARRDSGGTPPRLAQSEHGRLEMGKCTTTAETRINTGVFIVVQVYKNRRKRTRIERSVQEWGILVHPDNNGKPHKHWVFSILVHFWISSRGVYKNPVSVLLPGGEASLWRELWKTP